MRSFRVLSLSMYCFYDIYVIYYIYLIADIYIADINQRN